MDCEKFCFNPESGIVVFTDTLYEKFPYASRDPRKHDSIFFVTNGSLCYEKGSCKTVVKKGCVGYIAKGGVDISSAYQCKEVSYIAFDFAYEKGENLLPYLPFPVLCASENSFPFERLFRDALHCYQEKKPGFLTVASGILTQIVGLIYQRQSTAEQDLFKINRLEKAVLCMKENLGNPDFRVGVAGKEIHLSEKQFRRIFYEAYGKTPYVFLLELRLEQAKILLENTPEQISGIAEKCGFSDVYGFSHSFKKQFGIAPKFMR